MIEEEGAQEEGQQEDQQDQQDQGQQQEEQGAQQGGTIAQGGEGGEEEGQQQEQPYWPEDWREKMAEHYAAGDKKSYDKELKRLGRFSDPTAVYGMGREAESKLTSGKLIHRPDENASDDDKAAFRTAMGVPEKAEEYFEGLELDNGAVIGDADKPVIGTFAEKMHEAGASKDVMTAALNWYYQQQEDAAATLDEADDKFRIESEAELKEEMGASFRRQTNGIAGLFSTAKGGLDVKNEDALYSRLMGGRMADGQLIGNDPDMIRWLVGMNREINPAATVVSDGDAPNMQTVDEELRKIDATRRENKHAYFKDEALQARERELLEAKAKMATRAS